MTRFVPVLISLSLLLSGCGTLQHQPRLNVALAEKDDRGPGEIESYDLLEPPSIPALASGEEEPPSFDDLGDRFSASGERWLYGGGFGRTALNVGTAVVFPPYAIYLLGNAALTLAGFEPLNVSDLLPEEPRQGVDLVYDRVTSIPGRISAEIAGRDYIERE